MCNYHLENEKDTRSNKREAEIEYRAAGSKMFWAYIYGGRSLSSENMEEFQKWHDIYWENFHKQTELRSELRKRYKELQSLDVKRTTEQDEELSSLEKLCDF